MSTLAADPIFVNSFYFLYRQLQRHVREWGKRKMREGQLECKELCCLDAVDVQQLLDMIVSCKTVSTV